MSNSCHEIKKIEQKIKKLSNYLKLTGIYQSIEQDNFFSLNSYLLYL